MSRKILLPLVLSGLFLTSCAQTNTPSRDTNQEVAVEFNERQLDKLVTQYAEQLDLSRRQQRRIAKIEKRYGKQKDKLGKLKIGQKRNLQKEKAEALLNLLTDRQIEKLNELAGKKGIFRKLS
jgi:CBS-domain-containing membrane protein